MSKSKKNDARVENEVVERTIPDPEVSEKPKRRSFTAEYKLRILQEADACTGSGEVGALLRREGLYSSHLTEWRRLFAQGGEDALKARRRGRKPAKSDPLADRVAQLEREKKALEAKLGQAQKIIEVQKKISQILESPLDTPETDEND